MQDNLNRKYEFSLDMKKLDTQFQTGSKFSTQDVKTSEMYIQLTQNNLPMNLENSTVYANIDKPSGAKVLHQCEILDENKGIVKVDLSVQSICEQGVYKFEIVAINENEKIVSPTMTYESYKSLGDNELVESSNEFNALDKALSEVKQIDVKFNNVNNKIDSEIEKVNVQLDTIEIQKATKVEVDIERKRIDNLTKLEEGSTTGDAELIDIRIGADGVAYDTAGSSVREQFKKVNDEVFENKKIIMNTSLTEEKEGVSLNFENTCSNVPLYIKSFKKNISKKC